MFNIIARATLLYYCKKYPEAAVALQEWYYELLSYSFKNFNELKQTYGNASLVGDDRVVFNIMGNKYRLVVRLVFEFKVVQIKWFGTHTRNTTKLMSRLFNTKNRNHGTQSHKNKETISRISGLGR